jgi:hypothetical protein
MGFLTILAAGFFVTIFFAVKLFTAFLAAGFFLARVSLILALTSAFRSATLIVVADFRNRSSP